MNIKLHLRLAMLTAMLFMLVSAFKTQSVLACSPAWYEGAKRWASHDDGAAI